ncbi:MAG: ATP-binding protein [Acidobacteriota bacterium]
MNLIMGMSALLLESDLSQLQRGYLEISSRNVKRLLRLINGILDLAKVESGKVVLQATPFDLHEVLRETAATIATAAEQKRLELKIAADPSVWPYWVGDPERLQQILLNLIGNAVKFTAKGSIHVEVHPATAPDGVRGLRFEVSDTGCGIPPDQAHLIFHAFQQVDGAMNRSYEGTGLGLAITKSLVELMQGEIWVGPHTGPGTTIVFTAFFPRTTSTCVAGSAPEARRQADLAANIRAGMRILVAEDNAENVILLEAYLNGLSLELDLANNGAEALDKRRGGNHDLVLMDIQMPVMDGYTATREIRAWEQATGRPRVPIVALTAHALLHAAAESREAGCDGHLSKPVTREDLIDAIGQFSNSKDIDRKARWEQYIESRRPEFLANRREDIERLLKAVTKEDFSLSETIGHDCKGMSKGFGFATIERQAPPSNKRPKRATWLLCKALSNNSREPWMQPVAGA